MRLTSENFSWQICQNTKFKVVSHLPSQCTLTTSGILHLHGPCCGMLRKLKGGQPSFESPKSVSFASQMGAGYTGWKKRYLQQEKRHIGIILYTHIMWSNHSGRPVRLHRGGYGTVIAQSRTWYAPRNIWVTGLGETGLISEVNEVCC